MNAAGLTESERRFGRAAVERKRLFLALSVVGVAVGLTLGAFYALRLFQDPAYPVGVRAALVVLILLNARQNLRQFRYAGLLEKLEQMP